MGTRDMLNDGRGFYKMHFVSTSILLPNISLPPAYSLNSKQTFKGHGCVVVSQMKLLDLFHLVLR